MFRHPGLRAAQLAALLAVLLTLATLIAVLPLAFLPAFTTYLPVPRAYPPPPFPLSPPAETNYSSIFYHKTHKTGSVTIARSLQAYAIRHNLTYCRESGFLYITWPNKRSAKYNLVALQHVAFNYEILDTYLVSRPDLLLTSIRLPLQRSVSWFRQQNTALEAIPNDHCDDNKTHILRVFDDWVANGKMQASQFFQLQERTARLNHTIRTARQIVDQFSFIFVRETFRASFECLCKETGVRLCDASRPLKRENAKKVGSCVERVLLESRASVLVAGSERDLEIYELVAARISQCQRDIPPHCRCPEAA